MPENKTLELTSQVAEATVYRSQALVTRLAELTLEPGPQVIHIDNLPKDFDSASLRVSGEGTALVAIEDFRSVEKHYSEIPAERIQALVEGLEVLQEELQSLEDQVATIEKQKQFLENIGIHTTTSISHDFERKSPDPNEWKNVLQFLGSEGNQLLVEQRKLEQRIKKVKEEIEEIRHHLKRHQNSQSKVRQQVQVRLDCEEGGAFAIKVSYQSNLIRWWPAYDAKVDTAAKSVKLRYYGVLMQNTGEDWENVKVRFSTARPRVSGNPPALSEWSIYERLQVDEAEVMMEEAVRETRSMVKRKKGSAPAGSALPPAAPRKARMKTSTVESGDGANVVFTPASRGDIPGDGSEQRLLVMEEEFPNEFRYLSIPRKAALVYLTSKITNKTDFALLPGTISIFINGDFVGRSQLKELVVTGEKFELNLGVDEAIKVKHELKRRLGDEKGLFSKNRVLKYHYAISVDNQHERPETLIVRDHIPVSQEEKIKVKLEHIEPAENPDKDQDELPNGALEWKVEVPGRTKQKIEYEFTVVHDPDIDVQGL